MTQRRHFRFAIVALILALPLWANAIAVSTGWELSKFANKRALILEEDAFIPSCERILTGAAGAGKVTIKGDSENRFVLKFQDGENRQVFVGHAGVCVLVVPWGLDFNPDPVCRFAPISIFVPEGESSNWTGQIAEAFEEGDGATCEGEIYPAREYIHSFLHGPDGKPYKCEGKLSEHGTCYGRKIYLRGIPPKHRVEILE